jgi:hypothetical protein
MPKRLFPSSWLSSITSDSRDGVQRLLVESEPLGAELILVNLAAMQQFLLRVHTFVQTNAVKRL